MKCPTCGLDKEEIRMILKQLEDMSQRRTDELETLMNEKIDNLVNMDE